MTSTAAAAAPTFDAVEDRAGSAAAQRALATLRAAFHWHAARDDEFRNPIVKTLLRVSLKARDRILDDDELRAVWAAAENGGAYGALIRLGLLTGQRREKLLTMKWDDIGSDGVWTIATEPREKGNPGELKLPELALTVIRAQPRVGGNLYVLGQLRSLSKLKREFDARLPAMPPWVVHDLRRTARSLMSRAKVPRDDAERTLGHAVGSPIARVYDRHEYADAKAAALAQLANLIARIVRPPVDNVVALPLPAA
jgi:integrase